MRWTVQFKLAILVAGLCCFQAGAAFDESNLATEAAPLSPAEQTRLRELASQEQEKFYKRVLIPLDATDDETNLVASAGVDAPPRSNPAPRPWPRPAPSPCSPPP